MHNSNRLKEKNRLRREKRIRKNFRKRSAFYIEHKERTWYVFDKTVLDGKVYFIGEIQRPDKGPYKSEYAIFRAINVHGEFHQLKNMEILELKEKFECWNNWSEYATVQIRKDGTIKEANPGYWWGPKGSPCKVSPDGAVILIQLC